MLSKGLGAGMLRSRFGLIAAVVCGGLCVMLVVAIVASRTRAFRSYPFPELKQEGNTLVIALEQYRQAHGRYPNSFAEAGLDPTPTPYGQWQYELEGDEFTLMIGEYFRDGFIYYYSSRTQQWYADT